MDTSVHLMVLQIPLMLIVLLMLMLHVMQTILTTQTVHAMQAMQAMQAMKTTEVYVMRYDAFPIELVYFAVTREVETMIRKVNQTPLDVTLGVKTML